MLNLRCNNYVKKDTLKIAASWVRSHNVVVQSPACFPLAMKITANK